MTEPNDDAADRARDIFEQLRSDQHEPEPEGVPDGSQEPANESPVAGDAEQADEHAHEAHRSHAWDDAGAGDSPEPGSEPDGPDRQDGHPAADPEEHGQLGDNAGFAEPHLEGRVDAERALASSVDEVAGPGGDHHHQQEHQEEHFDARGGDHDAQRVYGGWDGPHEDREEHEEPIGPAAWHDRGPTPEPAQYAVPEEGYDIGGAEHPDAGTEQRWKTPGADGGADGRMGSGEQGEEEPPAPRELPRVLAIANQKGGVGKTTTAVNLGAALAELGYRVLVIDLDPQGNASTGLGINTRNLEHSVYDVILHDVPIEDCIEATSLRNLFVVPATIDLAGAEIELVPAFSREQRLRRALEEVGDDFDFTIIDCPPSLGLLTVNGLTAAGEVLVPIQCEYYALEGLGQLLRNINLVQGNLNPKLELSTIILTMYDARTKLAEQVASEVREHFGEKVCRTMVPRTVRLSEAPSFGQPVILFDPTSRGAIAYRELAKEVSRGAPQRAR